MVNKVISLVLGGAIAPIPPLGSAHAPGSENLWPNRSNGQNKTLCRVILLWRTTMNVNSSTAWNFNWSWIWFHLFKFGWCDKAFLCGITVSFFALV